eukprot:TRINITY_DN2294_c0_g1_i1.p1 TRINITY_DN2294_c0_g1~~TRINITY_DN2294_c0_g1_i1.p1  ORF type:complete len:158 (+),score=15.64 TRINITY_DN2294_c0_g1_i1:40-513(+)
MDSMEVVEIHYRREKRKREESTYDCVEENLERIKRRKICTIQVPQQTFNLQSTLLPVSFSTPSSPLTRSSTQRSSVPNIECGIPISIRTLTGRSVQTYLKPSDRVRDLKHSLWKEEGIPPDQQRLVFKGHLMPDDRLIVDYGLTSGDIVHLVLALRG